MLTHLGFWKSSITHGYFDFNREDGVNWNKMLFDLLSYTNSGVPTSLPIYPWFTVKDGVVWVVDEDPSKLMPVDCDVYTADYTVEPGFILKGGAFVAPPPPPPYIPQEVSRRQFAQIVAEDGLITFAEAKAWAGPGDVPQAMVDVVNQYVADDQRERVLFVAGTAGTFSRGNENIALFAWLMNKTNAEVDSWFIRGAALA